MSELQLEQLQSDIDSYIACDPWFENMPVLIRAQGVIENDVKAALRALNAKNKKTGACVMIMFPDADMEHPDAYNPELRVIIPIRVFVMPLLNEGKSGTKKPLGAICLRLIDLLNNVHFGDNKVLTAQDNGSTLSAFDTGEETVVATTVSFSKLIVRPALPQVVPVVSTRGADGAITLSMPSNPFGQPFVADIYYTQDGSFPRPGNAAATLYANPFTPEPGALVRFAAFKENLRPSNVGCLRPR